MTHPPEDADHDAWLRAALRHAPDRDVQPSPAVSERIRRSARKATAPADPWWAALAEAIGRLARPAPAAALASVMLATVIGVMWRDGPPPQEPAPAERAVRSQAPAAPAPSAARPEAPAAPVAVAPEPSPAGAPSAAANERSRDREAADRAPPPAGRVTARNEVRARKEAPTPRPDDTARVDKASAAAKAAPVEAPRPAEPARPAAPRSEQAAAPPPAADTAAPQPAPSGRSDAHGSDAQDERRPAPARAAPVQEQALAARLRAPAEAATGFADADPLAEPAAGWVAATPAQRAALDALRRATAGRWRPARLDAPGASTAVVTDAQGAIVGRLLVADGAVLWLPQQPAGFAWRATLPPAEAEALADRLRPPARAQPASAAPGAR